jgi:hypothetical protein
MWYIKSVRQKILWKLRRGSHGSRDISTIQYSTIIQLSYMWGNNPNRYESLSKLQDLVRLGIEPVTYFAHESHVIYSVNLTAKNSVRYNPSIV